MKKIAYLFVTVCCLTSNSAFALRPMVHYHDLIAGETAPGYRDGSFESAQFNGPQGMVFNEDGSLLFVADRNNNCIRMIFRNDNNRVETLAGSPKAGNSNGSLKDATFNTPSALAYIGNNFLVVYDSGNSMFRLIDLTKGQVSNLAGNGKQGDLDGKALESSLGSIWNMVYLPSDNSIYFSEFQSGSLRKLDLNKNTISTVLVNDPRILSPGPLCLYKNNLCVTDWKSFDAYQVDFKNNNFQLIGNFDVDKSHAYVLATAASNGFLYGFRQGEQASWVRLPDQTPLKLVTVWGKDINGNRFPVFPSMENVSFIPDPKEDRKFYLTSGSIPYIISLKDYNFINQDPGSLNSNHITDYEYPEKKPAKTFRILVVGNSIAYSFSFQDQRDGTWKRALNFPKQLELMLNTDAALEDVPLNYEVLALGHAESDVSIYLFPYYEVPDIVKKYDIDLVLYLMPTFNSDIYGIYFSHQLTKEGIPAEYPDAQYLAKPWEEKIPSGTPKDLFDKCFSRKWIVPDSKTQLAFKFTDVVLSDPGVRDDVVELLSKPIRMLSDKLSTMKTSMNQPVKYQMVLVFRGEIGDALESNRDFWKRMAQKDGFPLLDLVGDFIAFKTTYEGMYSYEDYHYNADGLPVFAHIVGQELINHHVIPFSKPSDAAK